jgi:hypothetical protein
MLIDILIYAGYILKSSRIVCRKFIEDGSLFLCLQVDRWTEKR